MTPTIAEGVNQYFDRLPADARDTLEFVRRAIRAAIPRADEVISYGIPTFRQDGRMVVAIAAFSKHCSFFPMSYAVIDAHKDQLARYKISKGTIRYPIGNPLPAAVVRKMVRARIAENRERDRAQVTASHTASIPKRKKPSRS